MKIVALLLALGASLSGLTQPAPPAGTLQGSATGALETRPRPRPDPVVRLAPDKPNVIEGHRVSYSGVAIQAIKTDNPLQLINPFAPARYGSGLDNLYRDPDTGRSRGFVFLAIKFR